jgi:hypothetical protein
MKPTRGTTTSATAGTAAIRTAATMSVHASLFNLFIDLPIYLLKPRKWLIDTALWRSKKKWNTVE